MKKLLATILAVVLAMAMILGTALADEQVLGDSNGDFSEAILNAPAGSKLLIEIEFTNDEIDWSSADQSHVATYDAHPDFGFGWGVGGLCFTSDWQVDSDFQYDLATIEGHEKPEVGDKWVAEFDVDAVKAAATDVVLVNFYNGCWVRKITLKTPDTKEDPKEDAPKTADTMTVVLFAGVAILALGAVVVTKKARA